MDTTKLIARLLELPSAISAAESNALSEAAGVLECKEALKDREAHLLATGEIAGKNAEERAANLRIATVKEREELSIAERDADEAKLTLSALQTELSCLRSVARLIARETE